MRNTHMGYSWWFFLATRAVTRFKHETKAQGKCINKAIHNPCSVRYSNNPPVKFLDELHEVTIDRPTDQTEVESEREHCCTIRVVQLGHNPSQDNNTVWPAEKISF